MGHDRRREDSGEAQGRHERTRTAASCPAGRKAAPGDPLGQLVILAIVASAWSSIGSWIEVRLPAAGMGLLGRHKGPTPTAATATTVAIASRRPGGHVDRWENVGDVAVPQRR